MIDTIFAIKFVHLLAAAVMFGTWLCLALFMLLAHRSGNTSVVALTAQFVVTVEKAVMIPAIVLQPLSGFPLATAIGLQPLGEFWILVSLLFYAAIVVCWVAAMRLEIRIRGVAREAALELAAAAAALPAAVPHLVRACRSGLDRHDLRLRADDLAAAARLKAAQSAGKREILRVAVGELGQTCPRDHEGEALRQRLKAGAQIKLLRRIVGVHRELDDRTAEIARQRRDPGDQRARDALAPIFGVDIEVLQENHRPIPSGDDALAACRHSNNRAANSGIRALGALGNEGGETGARSKAVAQPMGFAGAHGVQRILALCQQALEPHQRRNIARLRLAHRDPGWACFSLIHAYYGAVT